MKKLFFGIALFLLIFRGCADSEITAAEDEIAVIVDISAVTEDVYRADIEYFLDGDLMGGQAVSYADQTALKDRSLVFRLTPEEFPEGAALSDLSFHIVLSFDQDGIEGLFSDSARMSPSNPCEPFKAEYGNAYRYTVTGNYMDGLVLERVQQ